MHSSKQAQRFPVTLTSLFARKQLTKGADGDEGTTHQPTETNGVGIWGHSAIDQAQRLVVWM